MLVERVSRNRDLDPFAASGNDREHRLPGILSASTLGAIFFLFFWVARGAVPAGGSAFTFSWPAVWFPVAGAVFSGLSALDLLSWLLLHPLAPIVSDLSTTGYVLGLLGLFLLMGVWHRLRDTRYRAMTICLLAIIALYTAAFAVMYLRRSAISFDERHLRYAGILFFLLLVVAVDQWRGSVVKGLALMGFGAFAVYGLASYAVGARELMRGHYYDPVSGTSQLIVSPVVIEYLRSEMTRDNRQRAIAVLPSPEAAISLPRRRIIATLLDFTGREMLARQRWAGRAEKIFVIVQERMLENGKAEAVLRSFVDYEFSRWRQLKMDGMFDFLPVGEPPK